MSFLLVTSCSINLFCIHCTSRYCILMRTYLAGAYRCSGGRNRFSIWLSVNPSLRPNRKKSFFADEDSFTSDSELRRSSERPNLPNSVLCAKTSSRLCLRNDEFEIHSLKPPDFLSSSFASFSPEPVASLTVSPSF